MTSRTFIEDRCIPEPNSGCWLWTGYCNSDGYGRTTINGKVIGAHRLSYRLFCGEIPLGAEIMHKCDTPACVNPDHLKAGSHLENMTDSYRKGRLGNRLHQPMSPEREKERRRKIALAHRGRVVSDETRAKKELFTPEEAVAIFLDPRSSYRVAIEAGCSKRTIKLIRDGISYARYTKGLVARSGSRPWKS